MLQSSRLLIVVVVAGFFSSFVLCILSGSFLFQDAEDGSQESPTQRMMCNRVGHLISNGD